MWREYQFAVSGVGGKTEGGGGFRAAGDGNCGGFVPGAGSGGRGADALVPARVGAFDCGHGTFHAGRGALDVAHRQLNRREDDKVAEALVRSLRRLFALVLVFWFALQCGFDHRRKHIVRGHPVFFRRYTVPPSAHPGAHRCSRLCLTRESSFPQSVAV